MNSEAVGRYMLAECVDCAKAAFLNLEPSRSYAERAGRFLFAIGAHESDGWTARRQYGFERRHGAGGHGYFQIEPITVTDVLERLASPVREPLKIRCAIWYFGHVGADVDFMNRIPFAQLLDYIVADARLSMLFGRLKLLWDPRPIPETIEEQAEYWADIYNTRPKEEKKHLLFLKNYDRYCRPIIEG